MTTPRLSSIVIRVADVDRAARFYAALGLRLVPERHGTGPAHFSAECDGVLVEIYPMRPGEAVAATMRLGFQVGDFAETIERLRSAGGMLRAPPVTDERGEHAVVLDPDGHQIELLAEAAPLRASRPSGLLTGGSVDRRTGVPDPLPPPPGG